MLAVPPNLTELLINQMPIGIHVWIRGDPADDASLRLAYRNPAAETIIGIPGGVLLGHTIDDCFPRLRSLGIPQRLSRILDEQGRDSYQHLYQDDRVRARVFAIHAVALTDSAVAIFFEPAAAVRQEGLDEAAIPVEVAHEFNNVLMGILPFATAIKKVAEDDPRIVRSADYIAGSCRRGQRLTQDLLGWGRAKQPRREAVDLGEVVTELLPEIRSMLGDSRTLVFEPKAATSVLADRDQVAQVVVNLASNARDAMRDGGELTIRISERDGGSGVRMSICDTGPGIPKEQVGQIFNAFYTTKSHGTGLGLPIVQEIVAAHGGRITVDTSPGVGTTFHIDLPTHLVRAA